MQATSYTVNDAIRILETALASEDLVRQAKCVTTDSGELAVTLSLRQLPGTTPEQSDRQIVADIRRNIRASTQIRPFPKQWIVMEELPVTNTGEVDEVELEEMVGDAGDEKISRRHPTLDAVNPEEKLRAAFADVHDLAIAEVDLNRSFIELGGDSISAIRVMVFLYDEGVVITVGDLLTCRRLRDVPMSTDDLSSQGEAVPPGILRSRFGSASEWLKALWKAPLDQPVRAMVLKMPMDTCVLTTSEALECVVKQHPVLRSVDDRQSLNNGRTESTSRDEILQVHWLKSPEDGRGKVSELRATMRERGTVFEAHLFLMRSSAAAPRLVLLAHRLLLDKKSWSILLTGLEKNMVGIDNNTKKRTVSKSGSKIGTIKGHTINGGSANGHIANSHATNGNGTNGHAINDHTLNGHATNGHAAKGYTTNGGHVTNGHATNGHATNGHATNGHATNDHATDGHATNGHATNGHATNGHATNGHTTNGHATNGRVNNGNAINGHKPKTGSGLRHEIRNSHGEEHQEPLEVLNKGDKTWEQESSCVSSKAYKC